MPRKTALALISATFLGLTGARAPAPAAAQTVATDPRVEVWLYHSIVGIQTASKSRPTVRLMDASGGTRTVVTPTGQAAGGRWQIEFAPYAQIDQQILVMPGDQIEITLDGKVTRVTAPDMPVAVDADRDAVSGRVPPGTLGLYVQLHRDDAWLDSPTAPGAVGPVLPGADRRFEVDLAGKFDVAAGTWGEVVAVGGDGHYTIAQFAPPSVVIHAADPYAILRLTPPERPVLTTRNDIGTELFRSAPAYPLGGALYVVLMVPGGVIDNGIYQPGPDETVIVHAGDKTVLEAPMPELLASVDAGGRAVWGHATAGARTVVALNPDGNPLGQTLSAVVQADADGRFSAPFDGAVIGDEGRAAIQTHAGGGVARTVSAAVPRQHLLLYSHVITGTVPGWGALLVEQRGPDGSRKAWAETRADAAGRFEADLLTERGQHATLAPGDSVRLVPARGRESDIAVPVLTAEVDAAKRTMRGMAPPGAALANRVYTADPDFFSNQVYLQPAYRQTGRSDTAGGYALPCAAPACPMRYGMLTARVGSADVTLHWVDAPFLGLGVTASNAVGRATAGLPVTVTPIGRDGAPGEPRTAVVRPSTDGSLPRVDIPLVDDYPDGLAQGDRVRLEMGSLRFDTEVPRFDWRADTLADSVSGTGPPGRALVGIAFARTQTQSRPPAAATSTAIGAFGQWRLQFPGFDLRAGDDLQLYVLFDGFFMWWDSFGIEGDPEPTATAVPPPSATRVPATVEPTPTQRPSWGRPTVYLPWGGKG